MAVGTTAADRGLRPGLRREEFGRFTVYTTEGAPFKLEHTTSGSWELSGYASETHPSADRAYRQLNAGMARRATFWDLDNVGYVSEPLFVLDLVSPVEHRYEFPLETSVSVFNEVDPLYSYRPMTAEVQRFCDLGALAKAMATHMRHLEAAQTSSMRDLHQEVLDEKRQQAADLMDLSETQTALLARLASSQMHPRKLLDAVQTVCAS